MAIKKKNEWRTAKSLYIEQGKTAKDIAELLGVTAKTVGSWIADYNWKKERDARMASPANRIANIQNIIGNLAEERIELDSKVKEAEKADDTEEINRLYKRISQVDDSVSKWNKTLESINKESKVSLATYLHVMDLIFKSMNAYDAKLFMSTISFQEQHVNEIAERL